MLEKIFNVKNIEKSANYALSAGVFFTLLSYITSYLIFKNTKSFIGVATIIFTVTLTIPIIYKLFESIKLDNKKSFFPKLKHLFDFYIYFFIGSFIVLFLISLALPNTILSADQLFGTTEKIILPQKAGLPPPPVNETSLLFGIFNNNLYVMIISFVLSILYGAGSLFLLTLNASIFASTLSNILWQSALNQEYLHLYTLISCNMGTLFFHMIPEVIAYFLAAIAGGLLWIVFAREKFFSNKFLKTLKYSISIFVIAIIVLIVAAFIEVKISRSFLLSGICLKNTTGVLIATIVLIAAIFLLELKRKKYSK